MQNGQNCVLFVFRPDERGSEWATARGQGSIMRQRKCILFQKILNGNVLENIVQSTDLAQV